MANILIAYYSWAGSTGKLAEMIRSEVGGTLHEILPETPYGSDYDAVVKQAKAEIGAGYHPPLVSKLDPVTDCDVIFVGTPNWWSTMAPPVASFLAGCDLAGKTVVPFCSHGGGGLARCASDMAKLCPDSTVLDAIGIYSGDTPKAQGAIADWISQLGLDD